MGNAPFEYYGSFFDFDFSNRQVLLYIQPNIKIIIYYPSIFNRMLVLNHRKILKEWRCVYLLCLLGFILL